MKGPYPFRLHTARFLQPFSLEYLTQKNIEQHEYLTGGSTELTEIISMRPLSPRIENMLLQLVNTPGNKIEEKKTQVFEGNPLTKKRKEKAEPRPAKLNCGKNYV